jgi:flagellar biogenesis protein FliO
MTAAAVLAWGIAGTAALAAMVFVRRRQASLPGADAIRLVTSRYLGAKRFLTIVEVDGERLLLGLAGDHVSLVAKLKGPNLRESASSPRRDTPGGPRAIARGPEKTAERANSPERPHRGAPAR